MTNNNDTIQQKTSNNSPNKLNNKNKNNLYSSGYSQISPNNSSTRNNKTKHQNIDSGTPFQFIPEKLIFSDFQERSTLKKTLKVRNKDHVSHRIRVVRPDSLNFSIKSRLGMGKLAPGMELVVEVIFKPEERTDYSCELKFITEDVDLQIPIFAQGPRPKLLVDPPEIDFGEVPLRHEKGMRITISNQGDAAANMTLQASPPFRIESSLAQVPPLESFHTSIYFHPDTLADFEGILTLEYPSGDENEVAQTQLFGTAKQLISEIRLNTPLVVLPDSFASKTTYKSASLRNDSDIKVEFCWKQSAMPQEDETYRSMSEYIDQNISDSGDASNFADEVFAIEPNQGEIWPGSEIQFTISFTPPEEGEFERIAFCDVSGRESRLPLRMRAEGFGPQVKFLYDNLDLGDISINSSHQFKFIMENVGEIPASISLSKPLSLFGRRFSFNPSEFRLEPEESQTIHSRFCSDIVGQFDERFHWNVQGSQKQLILSAKGTVIGPSFHFDKDEIDFEDVAFNFLVTRFINITNTSDIPMKYNLRIPSDGSLLQREFDIIPTYGELAPKARKKVQIDFLPTMIQQYNLALIVDIENVGQGVMSIPVKATCRVPDVSLNNNSLNFGTCFINHPYTQSLELENNSSLSAKYEVLQPGQEASSAGKFTVQEDKGIVPGMSVHHVPISLEAQKVGSIFVPLYIKILGSSGIPFEVSISAQGMGPVIEVENTLLEWGRIPVLQEVPKNLPLKNNSPIPAVFYLSCDSNAFGMRITDGVIPPNSSQNIEVVAFLDEVSKFTGTLTIEIENGDVHQINLTARGKGHTIFPSCDLETIDFEQQLTLVTCSTTFSLENKGRKSHSIQWTPEISRKRNKSKDGPVFWIEPERATIQGQEIAYFTIHGKADRPRQVAEKFLCKSSFGKTKKTIFQPKIKGEFHPPLIETEPKQLDISYSYQRNENKIQPIRKSCTLTNRSALPLTLNLSTTDGPFSVNVSEKLLEAKDGVTVEIEFDPDYKGDRKSHFSESKLLIRYNEHPKVDYIKLKGDIQFPNLSFSPESVNFGNILAGLREKYYVTMSNPGNVPVHYYWVFEEPNDSQQNPSELFDVLPIRGVVSPQGECDIQFLHQGTSYGEFKHHAWCITEGGPEYMIPIWGESSDISFEIDHDNIDFGEIYCNRLRKRSFYIYNTGKVDFEFQIEKIVTDDGENHLELSSYSGTVEGSDKIKINVELIPRVPAAMENKLMVYIAHCEPYEITISARGVSKVEKH